MDSPQILDNYLTDEQLAQQFHVSPRTIKRWRREGKAPPSFRHGNKNITHVDDAATHLEAQREAAGGGNGAKRRAR